MKYTQKQLEEISDIELSAIICNIGKWHRYNFDINSWSDMGQLIQDGKISIAHNNHLDNGSWTASAAPVHVGRTPAECEYIHRDCTSENPLRAAAIVYILIKQGE